MVGFNIVYLSYFSNFVSSAVPRASASDSSPGERQRLSSWAPVGLGLVRVLVRGLPVEINRSEDRDHLLQRPQPERAPAVGGATDHLRAVAATLAGPAEAVGALLQGPANAYRYDLIGSLVGIVAFSILSFLRRPPVAWGVVVASIAYVAVAGVRAAPALHGRVVAIVVLL